MCAFFDGVLKKNMPIRLFSTHQNYDAEEIGTLKLKRIAQQSLSAGEVGYLIAGIKDLEDARVGDTGYRLCESHASTLARLSRRQAHGLCRTLSRIIR